MLVQFMGVAMCSDSGATDACATVLYLWLAVLAATAVNFVAGAVLIAAAPDPTNAGRAGIFSAVAVATALILACWYANAIPG